MPSGYASSLVRKRIAWSASVVLPMPPMPVMATMGRSRGERKAQKQCTQLSAAPDEVRV